jgi:hypothetical protein
MKILEILEKIKNYDKLQADYDKLCDECHQLKMQCEECRIYLQSSQVNYTIIYEELEEKK